MDIMGFYLRMSMSIVQAAALSTLISSHFKVNVYCVELRLITCARASNTDESVRMVPLLKHKEKYLFFISIFCVYLLVHIPRPASHHSPLTERSLCLY